MGYDRTAAVSVRDCGQEQQRRGGVSCDRPAEDAVAVAAVIVTHFPEPDIAERLARVLSQVDHLILVDNGSDAAQVAELKRFADRNLQVTLVANASNLGIASALNQAAELAQRTGSNWLLTLDQDSLPAPDMVERLAAPLRGGEHNWPLGIVAPDVVDLGITDHPRGWVDVRPRLGVGFSRSYCCEGRAFDVLHTITSGCLTNLRAWQAIGGFDEELFIDYVDTDYCLRLVAAGYRIRILCDARLYHRVGAKEIRRVGPVRLVPTHHSPLRRYYLCRNRLRMLRRHLREYPHWGAYELLSTLHVTLCILLVERQGLAKLKACLLGTWDGLWGRAGHAHRNL